MCVLCTHNEAKVEVLWMGDDDQQAINIIYGEREPTLMLLCIARRKKNIRVLFTSRVS